jgi:iron(III) transport system substrate-binding protein
MTSKAVRFALVVAAIALAVPAPARAADPALYEAAKKEGQLLWYTSLIVDQAVRPLIAAFNKKYPGIEVKFSRADSGPTAIKIIQEAQAGRTQADVFDGIDTTPPLLETGLAAPFRPSAADKYPAGLRDPQDRWNGLLNYYLTPAINTALVPKEQWPKSTQDLLDPKWKGKIAWSNVPAAGAATFIGSALMTMGQDKGMTFLRALAKQNMINLDITNRAIVDQVIFGEYPIALGIFNHHALLSARKGAPVQWLKVEPISAPTHSIGMVKDAPHPSAGKLFVDFLTSEDGQREIADAEYFPAMPSVPAKSPDLTPQGGGFTANYLSPDTVTNNLDHWIQVKKELFN